MKLLEEHASLSQAVRKLMTQLKVNYDTEVAEIIFAMLVKDDDLQNTNQFKTLLAWLYHHRYQATAEDKNMVYQWLEKLRELRNANHHAMSREDHLFYLVLTGIQARQYSDGEPADLNTYSDVTICLALRTFGIESPYVEYINYSEEAIQLHLYLQTQMQAMEAVPGFHRLHQYRVFHFDKQINPKSGSNIVDVTKAILDKRQVILSNLTDDQIITLSNNAIEFLLKFDRMLATNNFSEIVKWNLSEWLLQLVIIACVYDDKILVQCPEIQSIMRSIEVGAFQVKRRDELLLAEPVLKIVTGLGMSKRELEIQYQKIFMFNTSPFWHKNQQSIDDPFETKLPDHTPQTQAPS